MIDNVECLVFVLFNDEDNFEIVWWIMCDVGSVYKVGIKEVCVCDV